MTCAANLGYNALHLGKKRLWPWTNYFLAGGPSWADSFSYHSYLSCELIASFYLVFGSGWFVVSFLEGVLG
jgi:hypothetical protein